MNLVTDGVKALAGHDGFILEDWDKLRRDQLEIQSGLLPELM